MNPKRISRRRLMQVGAGGLLAAGLWPGWLAAQDAPAPSFQFVCVNDLHYWDSGCAPFFTRVVQQMKASAPQSKLLLLVGDAAEHGKPEEFAGIHDILKTSGMEIRSVIGNHDWTSQTDRKAYEQANADSVNYTFEHQGWQFIALDTSDGTKAAVSVQKPTLDWLDANLSKLDNKRPTILFTHFPMGVGVTNRPRNADEVLTRLKDFNLRAVFNGHHHAYTERTVKDFVLTTDKCCSFRARNHDGTPEKGFFVCDAIDGKITRKFIEVPVT
jgi:hypothetical protein